MIRNKGLYANDLWFMYRATLFIKALPMHEAHISLYERAFSMIEGFEKWR